MPQDKVVLGTILRAGLPLHTGFHNYFDHAENAFVSAYRKYTGENDFDVIVEYLASPRLDGKTLILVDPMLATGGSAVDALTMLKNKGCKDIRFMCLVAAPEGVKAVQEAHPDIDIFTAALDEKLNEHAYIVPGLGDAGDRIFGTI
jgi:uracil phosphoribosyltransferase